MSKIVKLQIGKNGLTEAFLEQVERSFENTKSVRVCLLKSATRNKKETRKIAEEIVDKLGKNFTYKIVGYTLSLRKLKRNVR